MPKTLYKQAKCATYGVGGYGQFPIRIGNINCTFQHHNEDGTINSLLSPDKVKLKLPA